jgi:hypothetical protein
MTFEMPKCKIADAQLYRSVQAGDFQAGEDNK